MGGDADVPCLKGKLQLYFAREMCGCLAVEKILLFLTRDVSYRMKGGVGK